MKMVRFGISKTDIINQLNGSGNVKNLHFRAAKKLMQNLLHCDVERSPVPERVTSLSSSIIRMGLSTATTIRKLQQCQL